MSLTIAQSLTVRQWQTFLKSFFSRVNHFLTIYKLLNPNQFGNRNKRITIDAILAATERIGALLPEKKFPQCTLID